MSQRIEFDKKHQADVHDLYVNKKMSVYKVAELYGLAPVTILRELHRQKIKMRSRGRQSEDPKEQKLAKKQGPTGKRAKAKPAPKGKSKPKTKAKKPRAVKPTAKKAPVTNKAPTKAKSKPRSKKKKAA
jgi:predicted HTH domain antitoxin